MNIRRAKPEDVLALAKVHVAAWQAGHAGIVPESRLRQFTVAKREAVFRQLLSQDEGETWLAEEGGDVLGFVILGACRDEDVDAFQTGEIWGLYVAPEHWRKGVGRRLQDFAEERLAAKGYAEAILWVFEANLNGRKFYEALGYALDDVSKEMERCESLPCVRYRRALKPA